MLDLKVQKSYDHFALDMAMEVKDGQITALVGPNGSGKTTLLKSLLGLIQSDTLFLSLFDHQIDELSVSDKENLGIVFADSGFSSYFNLNQIEKILSDLYTRFDRTFFDELASRFKLNRKKPLSSFSNGQKNLVKLIAALSHQARFLLLDEPTNGLDVWARNEVLEILEDYVESFQASILITSHISSDLEHFCDDLYLIKEGKKILHEEMDHLLENYGLIKVEEIPENFDLDYIIASQKRPYGFLLLSDKKAFYKENYPQLVIEPARLDDVLLLLYQEEV